MIGTGRSRTTVWTTVPRPTAAYFRGVAGHTIRRGQGHQVGLWLMVTHLFAYQINVLVVMIVVAVIVARTSPYSSPRSICQATRCCCSAVQMVVSVQVVTAVAAVIGGQLAGDCSVLSIHWRNCGNIVGPRGGGRGGGRGHRETFVRSTACTTTAGMHLNLNWREDRISRVVPILNATPLPVPVNAFVFLWLEPDPSLPLELLLLLMLLCWPLLLG